VCNNPEQKISYDILIVAPIMAQHYYKIGRITAKLASYRPVFYVFSMIFKKSRLILCREILLLCGMAALALKKEKGGDEELIVDVKVQNFLCFQGLG
jgi:hypothetical protein